MIREKKIGVNSKEVLVFTVCYLNSMKEKKPKELCDLGKKIFKTCEWTISIVL